jgi:hypothetical protein
MTGDNYSTLSQKRWIILLLVMKRKSTHPIEIKVSFHRMNAFYISLLTMKSSLAFGTVYFMPVKRNLIFKGLVEVFV